MATQKQVNDFILQLSKLAMAEYNKRDKWILPSVCIAMSALETGWGTNSLMKKTNSYFGIKVGKSKYKFGTAWKGRAYSTKTKEYYNGETTATIITDMFRAYDSVADSVTDYYDMLTSASRYSNAVNNPDARATITAIRNAGYATDPNYITNVMKIILKYNLTQYDKRLEESKEDISDCQCIYTVKAKDNLWSIANKYLGSGTKYKEIMKLNNLTSDLIRPGMTLKIPNK